jgi:pantetheine-phosphate adenylyltransferase
MATPKHTIAMFPGTFDPMTNGHLDLIRRALGLFDQLVVAVGSNPEKRALFTPDERVAIIKQVFKDEQLEARVEQYDGLTVDFAREVGAAAILRGIRNHADLNFEFQLALTNRAVADVETIFIMTSEQHGFTSSTLIKQIAATGQMDHLTRLLPPLVIDKIQAKIETDGDAFKDLTTDAHKD